MDNFLQSFAENLKSARERSLLGDYKGGLQHYDAVIGNMKQFIDSLTNAEQRAKWEKHRMMLVNECKHVQEISSRLNKFFDQDVSAQQKAMIKNLVAAPAKPRPQRTVRSVLKPKTEAIKKTIPTAHKPVTQSKVKLQKPTKLPAPAVPLTKEEAKKQAAAAVAAARKAPPKAPVAAKRTGSRVDTSKISYETLNEQKQDGKAPTTTERGKIKQQKETAETKEIPPIGTSQEDPKQAAPVPGTSTEVPTEGQSSEEKPSGEEADGTKFTPAAVDKDLAEIVERDILDKKMDTHWDSIAGLAEAKKLLKDAILLPIVMAKIYPGRAKPWKGVLLFGPPGTGKTMLAKAFATECKTTFFNVSPTTIASKWRGDSERMVRLIFEMARFYAPSTIFIDEIDSLCSARGGPGEHESSNKVKSEILTQLDGINSCDDPEKSVLLLGATNFPWALDEALRRRLDKRVYIPLPDVEGRKELLKISLKNSKVSSDVDFDELAKRMDYFSGADISHIADAVMTAPVRELMENMSVEDIEKNKPEVRPINNSDFEAALSKIHSSITKESISAYENWAEQYGAS